MIKRMAFRFQLKTNPGLERQLSRAAGCSRLVWNKGLALQKERLEAGLSCLSYAKLAALLVGWKQEEETAFLSEVHSQPLQQSLMQLDRALQDAFDKTSPKQFPRFKKRGKQDSFRYPQGVKLEEADSRIYLPKIGWVRYRKSRAVTGVVRNATVSRHGGKWYVSVQTEEKAAPQHSSRTSVGIDLGVVKLATLSDGTVYWPLNSFKRHAAQLARLQRSLSRKVKFSANWRKQKEKIVRLHSRIARIRRDDLHKRSTEISKNHAMIAVEDLQVAHMSQSAKGTVEEPGRRVKAKSGLNRAILDQGWRELRRQLAYKQEWNGGILVIVPPQYTSQTCSACGHTAAENRPTQALFRCRGCGYTDDADVNAAKNILAAGHAVLACGGSGVSRPEKQEPTERAATAV